MKKKQFYAILAAGAMMLSCGACSGQNNGQTGSTAVDGQETTVDTAENDSQGTSLPSADESSANPEETLSSDESANGQEAAKSGQSYFVTLDWQTIENSDTAEDGTLLYTDTCTYPVVSIEGNQEAADNINACIQSHVNAYSSDTSIRDFAQEDYMPENPAFIAYNRDMSFAARRSDSNVISFEVIFYAYSGGAHGNYSTVGLNFDTRTGEALDFTELGEDADSFHAATFAFNRALADTKPYQEKMYDAPSDEQLEDVLYTGDKWFLSTSGLTFISNPYELGPYAAGGMEFTIPYEELDAMGLKKEYRYAGNLTLKLQDSIPASMDLNGDGKEETILTETVYNSGSEFITHLRINDTDVTNGVNDELSQLLTEFPWEQFILYDLNPLDDTIEIAYITTEYQEEEDDTLTAVLTSFFFRYEKDGSISFLGKTDGSILNPDTVLSVTAPRHVSIDWQTVDDKESAEDGKPYYTSYCLYPVVSVEDNQTAADKINADIQSRVDAFRADTSSPEYAREYYEQSGGGFGGFDNLIYQAARSDDSVISFKITYYGYMGGAAHGNYASLGINYNARTGEPILFSELAQDADLFLTDTFAFVRELADTKAYHDIILDTDDEMLKSVLYREDTWFLAADGLVFISSPYALAAYSAGTINFVIPYEELKKMELKPEYQYPGNLTAELRETLDYFMDLNGDGKEDSIQFYTGYEEDAQGNYIHMTHLFINDMDVIQEELLHENEMLERLLADSYWTRCALYDLNPYDNTIEIAIMTAAEDHDEGKLPAFISHFFRYEQDGGVGGITYIGQMNGDVSILETF